MEFEQSSSGEPLRRASPRPRSEDFTERGLCPCGRESVATFPGPGHVLGPKCQERVERHVRRRFGSHRYGGRYAAEVADMIHDCYRMLVAPGGLDRFRPDPEREVGDAFGAWLWKVVHNHCNVTLHSLAREPAIGGDRLDSVPEARDAVTPDQAFARERIRELSGRAVAEVEPSWRAKGPIWSERLDIILDLISESESDTARACERLAISDENLRKCKSEVLGAIRRQWRQQILEGLTLEPGLTPKGIELMIDREIEALFEAAFPGRSVLTSLADDPESEPEPNAEEPESDP